MRLAARPWIAQPSRERIDRIAAAHTAGRNPPQLVSAVTDLVEANRRLYEEEAFNLNPATNVMNPAAEALLSAGLGSRTSLGYAGDKYETGLEHIEQIEVIAAEAAAQVFDADYAEVRLPSGAMANLAAFMATVRPGESIIASPATIGGHVTHHAAGAAGLYGAVTVDAPVDAENYTVDVDALAVLAREVRPSLITVGGSLNLFPHPVARVREVADAVGAKVLFDAAHVCGMIAGRQWPDPLGEGAHLMTMSTYKSLGGPTHGLAVTNDAALAERIEAIAFPGLTANFDAGNVAALAVTMADWSAVGSDYAAAMRTAAGRLAAELAARDIPVFECARGFTDSHQFAVRADAASEAVSVTGGTAMARLLERANLLTCGIGVPGTAVDGDVNALRVGTPEIVRMGLTAADMPQLADFMARALRPGADAEAVGTEVSAWRRQFTEVLFTA